MRLTGSCRAAATAIVALGFATAAEADGGIFDEGRLGVYEHDASVFGHQKESGADIGVEVLFKPFNFLWEPRLAIGGLVNTDGETDQAYVGLTWTWDFVHGVFTSDDGLYAEATLGGGWNNGLINVTDPVLSQERKSLGSNVLFREDVDLGYRFNPVWSIAVSYNHISNADLGVRNEGLNDIGVRVGMKF
ncbi:MAG TPA: acyloxyacyl hydrolase [Stellaceae bacterium]|nr:acyloxyacyl hydrolase [Stellaceae bacterium]